MNKRLSVIIFCAIITIVVIGVSAKPLLIKYLLYKYDRAAAPMSRIFDSSKVTVDELRSGMDKQSEIISTLHRLNYLTSYSIPIKNPRTDASDIMALIAAFGGTHRIPAAAGIDYAPSGTVLHITDIPDNRSFWEMFVRMYIEAKE